MIEVGSSVWHSPLGRWIAALTKDLAPPSTRELRHFGWLMAGFLIVIFGVLGPWAFSRPIPNWPWWTALPFILLATLVPVALRPIHRAWMALAHILGWINSRVLLSVFFYLVIFPTGLVRRWVGGDSLDRQFDPKALTYRKTHRSKSTMDRPF